MPTTNGNSNLEAITQLMQTLFGAFPRVEADAGMLRAYVLVVKDFPLPVIERAIMEIINHDEQLPKASQLRAAVQNLMPRKPKITDRTYRKRPPWQRITAATTQEERDKIVRAPMGQTNAEAELVRQDILGFLNDVDSTEEPSHEQS